VIHSPTVIAVDDNVGELDLIVSALRELDVACLPVRVEGAKVQLQAPLRGVRLVFFDINYLPGIPSEHQMFEVAATVLLKVIAPDNGPFVLITWSSKADAVHGRLMKFFARDVPEAPAPTVTGSLQKEDFTPQGAAKDGGASLREKIRSVIADQPQIDALMGWEIAATQAAGDVIESLMALFSREDRFEAKCGPELGQVLTHLAVRAVGEENVAGDRRAAMHEALVPILFDRLTHQTPPGTDDAVWAKAIVEPKEVKGFANKHGAALNALSYVAYANAGPAAPGDRGVVFALPAGAGEFMAQRVGLALVDVAADFVQSRPQGTPDPGPPDVDAVAAQCRWVFVGVRAICDQAQAKGALRPVVLALEVPATLKEKGFGLLLRRHGAATHSPEFKIQTAAGKAPSERRLLIDWHWTTSLSPGEMAGAEVLYRIREPLISLLTSEMSSYSARPGIITFD
jgi:hypothetical protein